MTFRVGQKVACVKVYDDDGRFGLRIGGVYTISKLDAGFSGVVCDVIEIKTMYHGAWRVDCFRPIVERKTSISIFTRMLNPSQVDA